MSGKSVQVSQGDAVRRCHITCPATRTEIRDARHYSLKMVPRVLSAVDRQQLACLRGGAVWSGADQESSSLEAKNSFGFGVQKWNRILHAGGAGVIERWLVLCQRGSIAWQLSLQPGEERVLLYKYERYVPSN